MRGVIDRGRMTYWTGALSFLLIVLAIFLIVEAGSVSTGTLNELSLPQIRAVRQLETPEAPVEEYPLQHEHGFLRGTTEINGVPVYYT